MPGRILFVRHGQSLANAEHTVATSVTPLSELGKEQAAATGKALQAEHIAKIICSPYVRAQQTAEIIAREVGYNLEAIEVIDELRERGFGEKEGGPKDHETPWYYQVNDEYGIESQQALIARMKRCLQKLQHITERQEQPIIVVGHATSGFYLQQIIKGHYSFADFDDPIDQKNAAIVELSLR